MKIAIAADGADLNAPVADKLGTAAYLIIVDSETGDFHAVPTPGATGQRGSGVQTVVLAVTSNVSSILVGYCNPAISSQLARSGIQVMGGLKGTVKGALEKYRHSDLQGQAKLEAKTGHRGAALGGAAFTHAVKSTARQFTNLLPVLIGVVLLIGLFNTFVSEDFLATLFSGNLILDTLWGACFGSILAGNPINSYVIGGELLGKGVSLFAVTALMVTWVTVGLIQLPAEIAALGRRFALLRNLISFALSLPISILAVLILNLVTG